MRQRPSGRRADELCGVVLCGLDVLWQRWRVVEDIIPLDGKNVMLALDTTGETPQMLTGGREKGEGGGRQEGGGNGVAAGHGEDCMKHHHTDAYTAEAYLLCGLLEWMTDPRPPPPPPYPPSFSSLSMQAASPPRPPASWWWRRARAARETRA